jgi:ATP-dependent Clp protease adapter protein ClpS
MPSEKSIKKVIQPHNDSDNDDENYRLFVIYIIQNIFQKHII